MGEPIQLFRDSEEMNNFEKAWSLVKMPKGDVMYMAEWDSRNFNWRGFGDTPEHALASLANKWENWVKQTGATIPLDEVLDDASVHEIISGGATMDYEYDSDLDLVDGPNDPTPDVMRAKLMGMDIEELAGILGDPNIDRDYRYLSREGLETAGDDEIADIYSFLPKRP